MIVSNRTSSSLLVLRLLIILSLGLSATGASIPAQVRAQANKPQDRVSLSQPLTLRWRYPTSTLNLTPASDDERVYLPIAGGTLVSLRAIDGQLYWKSEIGGEFSASPVADAHAVFVASETTSAGESNHATPVSATVRALGREGGVTAWLRTLSGPVRGSLAISSTRVFGATADGSIYALEKSSGNIAWQFHQGSGFNCEPAIANGSFYVGSEDGSVFALEETTGKLRWQFKTAGPVRGSVAVSAAEGVVYFGSGDGYVYAVSIEDGRLRWRNRTGAAVQAVASVNGGLLLASLDNFVYFLSSHGKRLWKHQLQGRISARPVTSDQYALFTPLSSDSGVVLALRDGKQVNALPAGEGINTDSAPIIVADAVLITTEHGLLAFSHPATTSGPSAKTP